MGDLALFFVVVVVFYHCHSCYIQVFWLLFLVLDLGTIYLFAERKRLGSHSPGLVCVHAGPSLPHCYLGKEKADVNRYPLRIHLAVLYKSALLTFQNPSTLVRILDGSEFLRIQKCGEDGGGRILLNWPRAVLKFVSFSLSQALANSQPTQLSSLYKGFSLGGPLHPHRG